MDNLFGDIYKNKKVFITGHTGFKGSWLTLWLTKLGANIIGYSKDTPTSPSHYNIINLDNIISVEGDVLDSKKLEFVINKYNPDIVFHLAAQSLVRKSYKEPLKTFETNIMGTLNLLSACRNSKSIKAIINVTSDKCYENKEDGKDYIEEDPMGGKDPYSASKGASELVSNSFRYSFLNPSEYGSTHNILLANARAGNVIGGGDWAEDRLVPDIMTATSKNKKVEIRSPESIRPWQYVLEPLNGYLLLGQKLLENKKEFADNWNFGPEQNSFLSVKELVDLAKESWDKIDYTHDTNKKHPHEAKTLKLSSQKAIDKLGWVNVFDYKQTIKKTVNWYKNYYEKNVIMSEDDLNSFTKALREHGNKKD